MEKKTTLVLLALMLSYSLIAASQPSLPGIPSLSRVSVSPDLGMGKPAIVLPGKSFSFKLAGTQDQPKTGYIWSVFLNGEKLVVANYTVTVSYSSGVVTVTIPGDVKPGLYDLVLVGQSKTEIPRSVWVYDTSKTTLKIVHVSDQHYGAGQPDVIVGDMNRLAGYVMSGLLGPDFIIDTGDIADTASEQQYRWAYSYELAFLYSYPILAIPGNHDTPPDAWLVYFGSTTWYRVIADKLLIIGLYSYEQGYPTLEQLRWAEGLLKQYSQIPVKVILVHHPVFYYQGELKTTYDDAKVIAPYDPEKNPNSPIYSSWSGNMNITRYFLKIVEENGVNYVLSGHVHRDLFVKYTSTRTGKTTYFLTITTLGMGSAIYDGLDFYLLDLKSGLIDFPVKPPTFIGFANDSSKLAQNSIPVGIYPPRNDLGVSNQVFTPTSLYQWPHAYVLTLENKLNYLNLENTMVWCLPWNGDFSAKVIESTGGSLFSVTDKLVIGDKLFLAVRIKLPYQSKLVVALNNAPDTTPPTINLKMLIPEKPVPGASFQAYISAGDEEWGVANFTAKLVVGNNEYALSPQLYTPGTILDPLKSLTFKLQGKIPENAGEAKLVVKVIDYAGHETTKEFTLYSAQQAPPSQQQPSQPSQPTQPSQPQQPTQPSQPTQPTQPSEAKPESLNFATILLGVLIAAALFILLLGLTKYTRRKK
ncbi:MAG: metallophosphoesterase family protein [Infirmifilum sp.]